VVFEEHDPYPTPVSELLESNGYSILGIRLRLRGLTTVPAEDALGAAIWDSPGLVATTEPDRARERLSRSGWRSLKPARRGERRGGGNSIRPMPKLGEHVRRLAIATATPVKFARATGHFRERAAGAGRGPRWESDPLVHVSGDRLPEDL